MNILNPTEARKNFYGILKQVNDEHQPIMIHGSKNENNAVILSQDDWEDIQETLYLQERGVDRVVEERREANDFISLEDIK